MPEELPLVPTGGSNLVAAGYDPVTQTLTVQFKDGTLYDQPNVTPELAKAFSDAPSKGSFHAKVFRHLGTGKKRT